MSLEDEAKTQALMEIVNKTEFADSGKDRVFIREAYDTAVKHGLDDGMSYPDFKNLLIDLSKKGLIRITRADLVRAYGEDRVERSKLIIPGGGYGGTERHFIVTKNPKLEWGELLKTKNPFIAPKRKLQIPESMKCLGGSLLGASGAVIFNKILIDKLPNKWHLPTHFLGASLTVLMPSSSISAGLGGAMFYAFINETYQKLIVK